MGSSSGTNQASSTIFYRNLELSKREREWGGRVGVRDVCLEVLVAVVPHLYRCMEEADEDHWMTEYLRQVMEGDQEDGGGGNDLTLFPLLDDEDWLYLPNLPEFEPPPPPPPPS